MRGALLALDPDELDAGAAAARADPRRRPALRAAGPDSAPAGHARRALAPLGVRARPRPGPPRARLADRRLRRGAVLQLPHAPARPARRPGAARDARRSERADPPAGPPFRPSASGPRAPPRRAPDLGGRP